MNIRVDTRRQRVSCWALGAALIAVLFSFLPGIGPPGDQTPAESELRYLILLVSAIAIGFAVLKDALATTGEKFFSTIGGATIFIATPLYLVLGTIAVGYFRAKSAASAGQVPAAMLTLAELSEILLFVGGALTYVATAAFAVSLGRSGLLGRRASSVFATLSLIALLCLAIRGLWFPNPKVVFTHWYAIPGYIVGIPAVPWDHSIDRRCCAAASRRSRQQLTLHASPRASAVGTLDALS